MTLREDGYAVLGGTTREVAVSDGFEVLQAEHREVAALFDRYEKSPDDHLAHTIFTELTLHTAA